MILIFGMIIAPYLGMMHMLLEFRKKSKMADLWLFLLAAILYLKKVFLAQNSGTIHRMIFIFDMIIALYLGIMHMFSEFKENPRYGHLMTIFIKFCL